MPSKMHTNPRMKLLTLRPGDVSQNMAKLSLLEF